MFDQAAVNIEERLHNITELEEADDRSDDILTKDNSQAVTGKLDVGLTLILKHFLLHSQSTISSNCAQLSQETNC